MSFSLHSTQLSKNLKSVQLFEDQYTLYSLQNLKMWNNLNSKNKGTIVYKQSQLIMVLKIEIFLNVIF